ncbi:putative Late nodulin [Medicago truncatula]|uniref:Nodule Cysteine-Rich (NCR) secreted peptide n=1 Tax=Medicago truncatula TaxID=3880 RepID=A0A072UYL2_MEDTR|nr:Nodule Cysteine-Rich (NCR) secreted peptide [Medicago truncatula]RHN67967.1 putative Late nodulin [Medicago truncatula]
MAEIIKYVYGMIIFIFLFLVSTNVHAGIRCVFPSDCPRTMRCLSEFHLTCKKKQCKCVKMFDPINFVTA